MIPNIIVTTDFSASGRNALAYACALAVKGSYKIVLLHVYTIPVSYTSDGLVLTAVTDALRHADRMLEDEMEWVKANYPGIVIEIKSVTGRLIPSLEEEISEWNPQLIIMGAITDYGDVWMWDNELLGALTSLPVPVLVIPQQIKYTSIKNIGFATDYRSKLTDRQVQFISWLTTYTGSQMHVVHITRSKPANEEVKHRNEQLIQETLKDMTPAYYALENAHVIDAIAHFVTDHQLDMLIVVPHKHGVWESLFKQSHTKQLAKLNHIPILAIPEP